MPAPALAHTVEGPGLYKLLSSLHTLSWIIKIDHTQTVPQHTQPFSSPRPPSASEMHVQCVFRVQGAAEPQMARLWDVLWAEQKEGSQVGDPHRSQGREFFPFKQEFQVLLNGWGFSLWGPPIYFGRPEARE